MLDIIIFHIPAYVLLLQQINNASIIDRQSMSLDSDMHGLMSLGCCMVGNPSHQQTKNRRAGFKSTEIITIYIKTTLITFE